MKIALIHLDLGLGGAERQTIDEAIALKAIGHNVTIFTSHHDKQRCFAETIDCNVLGSDIRVYGDWIPRNIFGGLHALMSIYRMMWCSLRVIWSDTPFDLIFIDQVSAIIPLFVWTKVIYYCHFPDLLLSKSAKNPYRLVLDHLEAITTAQCDELLVNSEFTKGVVLNTFTNLNINPKVVYPSINIAQFDKNKFMQTPRDRVTFLSINRYERKKEIDFALRAFVKLKCSKAKLVIAGGYDERVRENKLYFAELCAFCSANDLKYQIVDKYDYESDFFLDSECIDASKSVYFLTKFPDKLKPELFKECSAVLYTPRNEHFGIVPIESMLAMRPPIAQKSGGPLETIIDGKSGFLCNYDVDEWAETMKKFVNERYLTQRMGKQGRMRVVQRFSRKSLEKTMKTIIDDVDKKKKKKMTFEGCLANAFILISFVILMPFLLIIKQVEMMMN